MSKYIVCGFAALALAIVSLVPASPATAADAAPCARKSFKTKLVKAACSDGYTNKKGKKYAAGQKAAKKAMADFAKKAELACDDCHTSLKKKDGFPLTKDALKKFKSNGGK